MSDPFQQNGAGPAPGPGQGMNPRMQEFAGLIDQILGAHAGGWNRPCPVQLGDQQGGITPIQAVVNLTATLSQLIETIGEQSEAIDSLSEAIEENTAAAVGDDDGEPVVKRRRR